MKIKVNYEVCPAYLNHPIIMSGYFNSMEHYKQFAKEESRRGCYKRVPFVIKETKSVTEEEFNNYLKLLRN